MNSCFNLSSFNVKRFEKDNLHKFAYYLHSLIPKGSHVFFISPKSILLKSIPLINKRFLGFVVNGYVPGLKTVDRIENADIIIGEPHSFTHDGVIVHNSESRHWSSSCTAVIPSFRKCSKSLLSYDLVSCKNVIFENGIYSLDHLSHI